MCVLSVCSETVCVLGCCIANHYKINSKFSYYPYRLFFCIHVPIAEREVIKVLEP